MEHFSSERYSSLNNIDYPASRLPRVGRHAKSQCLRLQQIIRWRVGARRQRCNRRGDSQLHKTGRLNWWYDVRCWRRATTQPRNYGKARRPLKGKGVWVL